MVLLPTTHALVQYIIIKDISSTSSTTSVAFFFTLRGAYCKLLLLQGCCYSFPFIGVLSAHVHWYSYGKG